MYEEVKQSIINHEGKVNMIYKDHLGNGTFGIGHLVLPTDDLKPGVAYDDDKVMEIFEKDFEIALDGARKFIPEDNIEPVAFDVVIEMCFQLGEAGVSKFKKMLGALQIPNYDTAADEMLDSKWHQETPKRCEELSEIMRKADI